MLAVSYVECTDTQCAAYAHRLASHPFWHNCSTSLGDIQQRFFILNRRRLAKFSCAPSHFLLQVARTDSLPSRNVLNLSLSFVVVGCVVGCGSVIAVCNENRYIANNC